LGAVAAVAVVVVAACPTRLRVGTSLALVMRLPMSF